MLLSMGNVHNWNQQSVYLNGKEINKTEQEKGGMTVAVAFEFMLATFPTECSKLQCDLVDLHFPKLSSALQFTKLLVADFSQE